MFSDIRHPISWRPLSFAVLSLMLLAVSCTSARQVSKAVGASRDLSLSLPSDSEMEEKREEIVKKVVTDSTVQTGPLIMNAIRDEETGEMVATDVITASKVTARFRHVAERFGKVSIEFDINVPAELTASKWQLRFYPAMTLQQDTLRMEPIYITGSRYRQAQLRGYQRYNAFLASIITDTADFVRLGQLEIFLERNFPETFAMKNDTTIISEPEAENLFGVTQKQALEHYTSHLLMLRNNRRLRNRDRMYARCVKSPMVADGIRLDTVITGEDGSLVYRYVQEVASRPGLKKIIVAMDGSIYDYGSKVCDLPRPEDLVFYVSSLSTLADPTVRYMTKIISRNAYDRTMALIDFAAGRSDVDTSLGCNADELRRIMRSIDEIFSNETFEVDSMIVTASCSPEGAYRQNSALAKARAAAMKKCLSAYRRECGQLLFDRFVPENWALLSRLIASDGEIREDRRGVLMEIAGGRADPDQRERLLSRQPEYRHLRERLYPRLRTVQLEFYTHRAGMVKDTVHTVEPDTVYMAGVEALRNLDYKRAVELLRPYRDYNCALALVSMSYNHTALDVLKDLDGNDPRVLYLSALALARLERWSEALDCYRRSVELDGAMVHRANLDPEISELTRLNF